MLLALQANYQEFEKEQKKKKDEVPTPSEAVEYEVLEDRPAPTETVTEKPKKHHKKGLPPIQPNAHSMKLRSQEADDDEEEGQEAEGKRKPRNRGKGRPHRHTTKSLLAKVLEGNRSPQVINQLYDKIDNALKNKQITKAQHKAIAMIIEHA